MQQKEINNTSGRYVIKSDGTVYDNFKNRYISQCLNKHGYLTCSIVFDYGRKTCNIHKLIAEHFIPNPKNKICVNHIDHNKQNNNIKNLEWVTYKENTMHSMRYNRFHKKHGEGHYLSKLKENQINIIRQAYVFGTKQKDLSKIFNVSQLSIHAVVKRKTWKHVTKSTEIR